MKLYELIESFSPDKTYLHGGPAELIGGSFRRGGNRGHDMGGLFFIEENEVGYQYALGYAIMKHKNSGIWRVKINLPKNRILDWTNPKHKAVVKNHISPAEYQSWEESKGSSGHLDWAQVDEELMEEMGFLGAIFHERSQGVNNLTGDAVSVGIWDPKYIEIIDFIPKEDIIEKYR